MTSVNSRSDFIGINDNVIITVASGALGNAVTSFVYFDWGNLGFRVGSLKEIITATTLTIESCNIESLPGVTISGTATSTDGTGATLVCSTLNSVNLFSNNSDLNGIKVVITADTTTPSNVGLERLVTSYTGASGAMTLSSAFGATTSGVTQFQLVDNPALYSRRVSDPPLIHWDDITAKVTGASTITETGLSIIDENIYVGRIRIRCLTTNATNALTLRLARGR